ncbi:MAG: MipA/OmpV family protein [Gallionella sp.]|nr:MipA/OmpV family protein [Gallionella sp.]MDD4958062.1 MipA/OmpV family protein [Gallionella sp.]
MKKLALLIASSLLCQVAFAEDNATGEQSDWNVVLGGGIASAPRYEGSATNRLRFIPLINVQNGHFFAGTTRGIGYDFSDDKNLQYGLRLTLAPYRRQNADAHLNGMGDIGTTGELGGFLNARFSPWYVNSSLAASSHGTRLELGAGYETRLSAVDQLRAGVDVNWANNKYMQTYFGVTAAQAAASGGVLTAFNASSGIKDYAAKVNWTHNYSKAWFSNAGITVKQLSGSAQNSPLTMRRSANSLSFVVGYHF